MSVLGRSSDTARRPVPRPVGGCLCALAVLTPLGGTSRRRSPTTRYRRRSGDRHGRRAARVRASAPPEPVAPAPPEEPAAPQRRRRPELRRRRPRPRSRPRATRAAGAAAQPSRRPRPRSHRSRRHRRRARPQPPAAPGRARTRRPPRRRTSTGAPRARGHALPHPRRAVAVAQNQSTVIQAVWQVQRGCESYCWSTSQSQTSTPDLEHDADRRGDGRFDAAVGRPGREHQRHDPVRVAAPDRLRVVLLRHEPGAGGRRRRRATAQVAAAMAALSAWAENVAETIQEVWQLQLGCQEECHDTTQTQIARHSSRARASRRPRSPTGP